MGGLAARQHGVVSRGQLRALGLSDGQITYATETGLLTQLFRGTFAVGHPAISGLGRMQAATLSCGSVAAVSHGSAAWLLGLTNKEPVLVHVAGPGERGRGIDGIRWHRSPPLALDESAIASGIRCTTVARTLVDLAGGLGESSLRGLVEEAAVQRSLDVDAIERMLSRNRRRGAPQLRALLAPWRARDGDTPTLRSPLEARLWPRITEHGLTLPEVNKTLEIEGNRLEVDFVWEEERLVVETDGAATHGTATAFHRDRRRDQLLVAAGYRVIRVTWRQLEDEPEAVVARILRILAAAG